MKNIHIRKSTILAVAFFGIMTAVSISAANAQIDIDNPLISTTGPNVLGQGRIQWDNSMEYHHLSITIGKNYPKIKLNGFGANTGLRFGIGDRAELTLNLGGAYNTYDTTYYHNTTGFTPAVGAKLLLFEGKGWLPMTAFFTKIALPVHQNAWNGNWNYTVQPEIGFQFRNLLGGSYFLDYSLGCSWNSTSSALADPNSLFQYSLYLYRVVNGRRTYGVGIDNINSTHRFEGCIESRWQTGENLQLLAKLGFAAGISMYDDGFSGNIDALVGISWMLK